MWPLTNEGVANRLFEEIEELEEALVERCVQLLDQPEAIRELTRRELDVLHLLASEESTSQIAQRLYVAPSTVKTQVKSIYRKLGVSSRKEAVEEAYARGII